MSDEKKPKRVEVYWTTVTYKTLVLYGALILAGVLAFFYLVTPDWFAMVVQKATKVIDDGTKLPPPVASKARFINLDGKVEVRKTDSTRWVPADFRMTLERGDLVQTGADGVARIVFTDGTTYTVKPETLITVEENSMAQDRSTRTAVKVTTGAVDLSTGSWEAPGSKAEVSFANATASMQQNSRAAVRTDPTTQQSEITLGAGGANLVRAGQQVPLGQHERASFSVGGPVTKTQVLAPPELKQPLNAMPIIVEGDTRRATVTLEWGPVQTAVSYQVRVSRTSMFTQVVAERRTNEPRVSVAGLEAGDYFWAVSASDAQGKASEPSETWKFILASRGVGREMFLEIEGVQLHGSVAEVIGRTEPGAAVLVNGQPVANVGSDGRFRHFTERLARGSQKLQIIGQNRRGGVAQKTVDIVVP